MAPVFQVNGIDGANNSSSGGSLGEILDNGDLVIVSGQKTVSTAYYEQTLSNMLSVAGLERASNQTLDIMDEKSGSFSEFGSAALINAPMMAGIVALGSEVCGDLMASEFDTPQAQRRIFASVDFNSANVDAAAIDDMIRRMARSFWQRNENNQERELIQTAISELNALAEGNENNQQVNFRNDNYRRGALRTSIAVCSAMISSTSAIEI